ncbi:uncharacterized protein METZ01_LOCUS75442 [marine metagenome]|uniref:Uncharacterized protein n=1 Tax=marine metagenome TaxID=408172 RepID=A0A381U4S0_9ZZZZ
MMLKYSLRNYVTLIFYVTLLRILPRNGSNCLNKLKKSSAHHAKKKVT